MKTKLAIRFSYLILCLMWFVLAGFLHSVVEEFNRSESEMLSVPRMRHKRAGEFIKRLVRKGLLIKRGPKTWIQLENYMQPSSSPGISYFAGAYSEIEKLAKEFRSRFLNRRARVPYVVERLLIILGVMWAQGRLQTFSFDDPQISMAKKTLLLCLVLHGNTSLFMLPLPPINDHLC